MKKVFLIGLMLLFYNIGFSADDKISAFTSDTSPTGEDLLVTVDAPGTTPVTKQATINLVTGRNGLIRGMLVTYKDANEVYISSGECDVNGTLVTTTSTTTLELTTTSATDFYYIYLSAAGTFTYSNTEPAYSDTLHGWYNTTTRCVGVVYTSGENTILSFISQFIGDKCIDIHINDHITIASAMNPSSAWQTPDDFESSVYCPINSTHLRVYLTGYDAAAECYASAASYESATANANITNGADIVFYFYQRAYGTGVVTLGTSRNIKIAGIDDDDNNLSCDILGWIYSR